MASFLPFVSVIVPARDEEDRIADCLESLLRQDYPKERFEVIVVDNGSQDETASIIRRFPVHYVRLEKEGASLARNIGAGRAQGEFLAFTDSDCVVPTHWLSQLVGALAGDETLDAVGGDARVLRGSLLQDYFVYCGAYSQREFFSNPSPLPWLDTGNLMVRRSSFERTGGFERTLFPGEDIDFSWRITLTGGRLKYLPQLSVKDKGPDSLAEFYHENFRSGGVSFLLKRRYHHLFKEKKKRMASSAKIFRLLFSKNGLSTARRVTYLLLLVTGHFAFRMGRLGYRMIYDCLRKPLSVPVLPKAFCEDRILYLCCPSNNAHSPPLSQSLSYLLQQIDDWDKFLKKAERHRLIPRLYSFLKRNGAFSALEPSLGNALQRIYLGNQAYVLAHEAELEALLLIFEKEGIDILLLKGAALAQTVYREKSVRFFLDLDLLIRPHDFERVDFLLRQRGYEPCVSKSPFPSSWHETETRRWLKKIDFAYLHPERQTNIDLHTELFEDPSLEGLTASQLWQRARRISVGESSAWIPDPNHLFLHLLFHLAKHLRMGQGVFGWFLDLDESFRHFEGEMDGEFLWRAIQRSPLSEKILGLLSFIHFYFRTPLPQVFLKVIEERSIEPLSLEEIFSRSVSSDLASFNDTEWLDRREQFLANLEKVRGMGKKIFYILRWLFPNRKYFEDKYPFGNGLERIRAYGQHWAVMAGKGISVGLYLVKRELWTRRVLQKEEKSVY